MGNDMNVNKLHKELVNAGIEISGCNEFGIVWATDGHTEIQNRADVKAIIAKHDPTPMPVETLEEKIARIAKVVAVNEIDKASLIEVAK